MTWEVLGGDPVPGEPEQVRRIARRFGDICADATSAHARLDAVGKRLGAATWTGAAAEAFGRSIADLLPDLRKMDVSFDRASHALTDYAAALEEAQNTARRARSDAQQAADDRTVASNHELQAEQEAGRFHATARDAGLGATAARAERVVALAAGDAAGESLHRQRADHQDARRTRAEWDAERARDRARGAARVVAESEARLRAARSLADTARELRVDAGRRAVAELDEAGDAGIPNRTFIGEVGKHVTNFVRSPEFDQILSVLDGAADVLLALAPIVPFAAAAVGGVVGIAGGPAGIAAGVAAGFSGGVVASRAMGVLAVSMKGAVLGGRTMQRAAGVRGDKAVVAAGVDLVTALPDLLGVRRQVAGQVKRILAWQDNRKLSGVARTVLRDVTVAPRPANALDAAKVVYGPLSAANDLRTSIQDIGSAGTELVADISRYERDSDGELLEDAVRDALPLPEPVEDVLVDRADKLTE
ncbi:WXG100 family type VII secretion target [Saccharothrix longispora]|uniref:WXG100 family type VII secretion target n=1 Tax=Saccharothrix longispora TaxID=33920 RepID=UPI0028FD158A|nr:WXG100 family type VII secretion target [Saccharothrix longispora]MDU0292960.1 WXG100 family type VII secretion target [Saccharothrix longispora]